MGINKNPFTWWNGATIGTWFGLRGKARAGKDELGNVGGWAARLGHEMGMKIVAVSDVSGALYNPNGLNIPAISAHAERHPKHLIEGYHEDGATAISNNELLELPVLVLIPAALENVITADNAERIKAKIVAELANGPTTPEADAVLDHRRDEIFVIPDILCNSGGVIVSYFEWVQGLQQLFWDRAAVVSRLTRQLDVAFERVMSRADRDAIAHRTAAMALGVETVLQAKNTRGLFP